MRAYDVLIKMWLGQSMPLLLYRLNARKGIVIARKTSLHNDHEQVLDFFSSRFLPFSLYCCPFSSTRCKTIEIQNAWPWRVNTSFVIVVNLLPCQQSITGKYINARLMYEPILCHNPNHTFYFILFSNFHRLSYFFFIGSEFIVAIDFTQETTYKHVCNSLLWNIIAANVPEWSNRCSAHLRA